jgi:hypothetical protein
LRLLNSKKSLGENDKQQIIAALNNGEKSTTAYDMNNLNKTIPTESLSAASSKNKSPIPASSSSSKPNPDPKLIVAENEDDDVFYDANEEPVRAAPLSNKSQSLASSSSNTPKPAPKSILAKKSHLFPRNNPSGFRRTIYSKKET